MSQSECQSSRSKIMDTYAAAIHDANQLLIFREFHDCLIICQERLNELRQFTEDSSYDDARNTFCVISIQALAELNRWQEALPLVTLNYPDVEKTPANIIQLCILLHAQVQDYPTSTALANIWLKNPEQVSCSSEEQYLQTVDVYVGHVLIPAGRWDDIEPFLATCPGLGPQRLDQFVKVVRALKHQVDQLTVERIEEIPVPSDEANSKQIKKHKSSEESADMISWKTLKRLVDVLRQMWRRMFAPFREIKH